MINNTHDEDMSLLITIIIVVLLICVALATY
jgi:hypothetical protein